MRNLIYFLARHHAFFIFIFLEMICIYLISQQKTYHRSYFINTGNVVTGKIFNTYNEVTEYFYLKDVNDSLMWENAQLRGELENAITIDTVQRYEVVDSLHKQVYSYIPAKVINNTVHQVNNHITINRGSKHGISRGMGVIVGNKIVGKIVEVSENYAVAMSALHQDSKISSKILPSGARGTLIWNSTDPTTAHLEHVSQPAKITIGDSVVTAGSSTIFPEGIFIGRVTNFDLRAGSNFYDLALELATPFNSLQYVYVVDHLMKEEQLNIEEASRGR